MVNEKMNKQGRIILRDIMLMVVIFAGVMALIGIFVNSMADEYSNTNMSLTYEESGGSVFGTDLMDSASSATNTMIDATDDNIGSFQLLTGIVKGAGAVLKAVVTAPLYIGSTINQMLISTGVLPENSISPIIINIVTMLLYIIITFVILSALLKGGEA